MKNQMRLGTEAILREVALGADLVLGKMKAGQGASQLTLPLPLSACRVPGTWATLDSAARGCRGTVTVRFSILPLFSYHSGVKSWCVSARRRQWKV